MGKEEFLKRLTYLLRDIPEEEMQDAVSYYRSYLEEAGPEREEEVLAGFGTPEQVAEAIRANLAGEAGSEWKRAPENRDARGGGADRSGGEPLREEKKARPFWQYLLMGLALIVFGPLVLSVIVGVAGSLFGGLALLAGFFLLLAVLTAAMLLGGISLTVLGAFFVFPGFWPGILLIGLGLLAFGGGCILLCCSWLFYGCFLPWLGRGIWGIFAKKG
ncbi:HAAS signaling domain-containing protein [Otoolea muris]|uniref:HAAS signaling domain-containing protein n=1 Tax=Otoolea muris TaxID=2941515 RepID=UPI00203D3DC4|nr:hypothetical protein [Otoolea muris]